MGKLRIVILLAVLLIVGIMLTVSGVSDIIKMSGIVPDFNYESMSNIKKGDIVHGDIVFIFDCYAGETTTNTTMGITTSSYTSREYFIMPLINDEDYEKDMYISISASKESDRNMLYDLSDKTWEYMLTGDEEIEWPEDTYLVLKADKLDSELMGYMVEWFDGFFDEGENIGSHIIPYDLVIYNPNSAYISLVVGVILLIIPIIAAIIFLNSMKKRNTSYNESGFTGYSSGNSDMAGSPDSGSFSESAFSENSAQSPYIPQPIQPEEFFAKPERNEQTEFPVETNSFEHEPEKNSVSEDYSNVIDTYAQTLREQEKTISSNYDNANDNSGISMADINIDSDEYFDKSGSDEDDADIFGFTNDEDLG